MRFDAGALADRPDPGSAPRMYYAIDAGTSGITYYDDGTQWVVTGKPELGRVESVVNSDSPTNATLGDTLLILPDVDVEAPGLIDVELDAAFITGDLDQTRVVAYLLLAVHGGAYSIKGAMTATSSGASGSGTGRDPVHRELRLDLAPGAYDFKCKLQAPTSGRKAGLYADDVAVGGLFGPSALTVRYA